jgi:hypothetical protein
MGGYENMSHVGNKLKAGFFATPILQGEYLTQLIQVSGSGVWLDPTCGEGEILNQLSSPFQSEDCTISTYGVELDKGRAEKAKNLLTHCLNAPIESMVIQNEAVSLLYLNPPYDYTMKGMDDESAERKEWTELYLNTRYLKDNGLMIYVIPSYRFADKRIARFLATHFANIGMLRFSEEDYEDYSQCIFIGNKKTGKHKEFNQKLFDFLCQMESDDFIMSSVTPINKIVGHHKWKVPTGDIELKTFYTKLTNKEDYVEGIRNSKGFLAFMNRSKPKQLVIGGDPILPLNQGQMALLLASGAINGEIGNGDNYHLVQGLEIVSKIVEEEKRPHDNGTTTTVTKTRTKRDVSVKCITPQGIIRKLV